MTIEKTSKGVTYNGKPIPWLNADEYAAYQNERDLAADGPSVAAVLSAISREPSLFDAWRAATVLIRLTDFGGCATLADLDALLAGGAVERCCVCAQVRENDITRKFFPAGFITCGGCGISDGRQPEDRGKISTTSAAPGYIAGERLSAGRMVAFDRDPASASFTVVGVPSAADISVTEATWPTDGPGVAVQWAPPSSPVGRIVTEATPTTSGASAVVTSTASGRFQAIVEGPTLTPGVGRMMAFPRDPETVAITRAPAPPTDEEIVAWVEEGAREERGSLEGLGWVINGHRVSRAEVDAAWSRVLAAKVRASDEQRKRDVMVYGPIDDAEEV